MKRQALLMPEPEIWALVLLWKLAGAATRLRAILQMPAQSRAGAKALQRAEQRAMEFGSSVPGLCLFTNIMAMSRIRGLSLLKVQWVQQLACVSPIGLILAAH